MLFQSSISRDTPIYFISPVAKASLAYASIFAEWLSKEREDKVYIPEEPFIHSEVSQCQPSSVLNLTSFLCLAGESGSCEGLRERI